jgi:hypothetical protein
MLCVPGLMTQVTTVQTLELGETFSQRTSPFDWHGNVSRERSFILDGFIGSPHGFYSLGLVVAETNCLDVLQTVYSTHGANLQYGCLRSRFHQRQQLHETSGTYVRFQVGFAGPVFLKTQHVRITNFLINPACQIPAFHLHLDRNAAQRRDHLDRAMRLGCHPQTELEHALGRAIAAPCNGQLAKREHIAVINRLVDFLRVRGRMIYRRSAHEMSEENPKCRGLNC